MLFFNFLFIKESWLKKLYHGFDKNIKQYNVFFKIEMKGFFEYQISIFQYFNNI